MYGILKLCMQDELHESCVGDTQISCLCVLNALLVEPVNVVCHRILQSKSSALHCIWCIEAV